MNNNKKVYYVYVENGKAVITEEAPDFDKIHDYMLVKADGIELFMGVHKNLDDLMLPDEPIDVARKLIQATATTKVPKCGALYSGMETESIEIIKYDVVQLQEIAEHLLVYCKAQERGCKDACCENYKSESV